jgi:aminopeptidase N
MQPHAIEEIARQRSEEVRRLADAGQLCQDAIRSYHPIRHRTGWALVAIGLRIAHDSDRG